MNAAGRILICQIKELFYLSVVALICGILSLYSFSFLVLSLFAIYMGFKCIVLFVLTPGVITTCPIHGVNCNTLAGLLI